MVLINNFCFVFQLQKRQRKREAQKLKELSEGKEEVQDNSSKDDALLSHFKAIEQDCNEGDKEDGEQLKDGCVSKGNIDSKEKGDDRDESDHEPSILQIPGIVICIPSTISCFENTATIHFIHEHSCFSHSS